ncbi:MAG TPA: flagellar hook-length control protein FliK, partial [Pirellula sp.]|nr:flagellar hook-length control protein FliK [Pirellula sp.]
NSNEENVDVSPKQTRNKRAEHLAKKSTESEAVSDERDTSSETIHSPAHAGEAAKTETPSDQHSLSFASEQKSSSPITSISPVIAPSTAFNTSVQNTTTSHNARPNGEGISAIATSSLRGDIQTISSSTTFIGSSSNPPGAEQGRVEIARSNAGPHISAFQETKLVQRVLRGVEQLANGGGQVRLRLHPPELGSLQMSLRMEDGQVFAKLEVENSTARDALLNNIQTLRDRLAEQGMRVVTFKVEVSTDSAGLGTGGSNDQGDGGTQSQSRWNNATSRVAQQNENRLPSESKPPERKPGAAWTRTSGSIDLTV